MPASRATILRKFGATSRQECLAPTEQSMRSPLPNEIDASRQVVTRSERLNSRDKPWSNLTSKLSGRRRRPLQCPVSHQSAPKGDPGALRCSDSSRYSCHRRCTNRDHRRQFHSRALLPQRRAQWQTTEDGAGALFSNDMATASMTHSLLANEAVQKPQFQPQAGAGLR